MGRKIKRRTKPVHTQFDEINTATLGLFRYRLEQAFKEIGKEFGLTIKAKSMTYHPTSFTGRYEAHLADAPSPAARHYTDRCEHLGLPKLGAIVTASNGKQYKIVGWNKRARKRPVLVERHGKTYTMTINQINQYIKKGDVQ